MPDMSFSFEAGDIIGQVMSFGSPTPMEVAVQGPRWLPTARTRRRCGGIGEAQVPSRSCNRRSRSIIRRSRSTVDRERAGQYGLTASNVTRSLVAATSSSRFIEPNYWRDPVSGNAFQIQVEIPQNRMASVDDVRNLPVMPAGGTRPLLGDVADFKLGKTAGEIDRYNMQRVVSFTANVEGEPLGQAAKEIRAAIRRAGDPPRGVTVNVRGQIPPLEETLSGLRLGLSLSVGVIFLLLAGAFQSFRLAVGVVLMLPAVLAGVALSLALTGTTLNVQSFTGAIMALGIAVANAILLVSFAERTRLAGTTATEAAATGATDRLRAVLMTATAMIAGMIPIALGSRADGSPRPCGNRRTDSSYCRDITGVAGAVCDSQSSARAGTVSLDPSDPESRWFESR